MALSTPLTVMLTLCSLYFLGLLPNFVYFTRAIKLMLLVALKKRKTPRATQNVSMKIVDRHRVPLSDIDFNLHMNNQSYHNYVEQGRWRVLLMSNLAKMLSTYGLGLSLTGNTIRW